MKPVQDMLNFLWKKTSRKTTGGEPPIIQASSVNGGSFENVHRFKQKTSRPRSMYVETNSNFSQVSSSASLDENQFVDACVDPNEGYTQHCEADACRRDMPYRNVTKNKSESHLNSLADGPAKFYNSPKIGARYLSSARNSGHSRSHSVYTNVYQGASERTATKADMEITPRMYKKNPSNCNKVVPHHGGVANVSFDGSTTGSAHSDFQGSQWSFWEEGSSDPVPPPRKRRSKPQEAFSETSSQSSADRGDISKLAPNVDETRRHSEGGSVSPVSVQYPMEFSLYLPPGFSNLGLDLLAAEFNTEEFNSDWKTGNQTHENPEQCSSIQKVNTFKLESTHDPEITRTHADHHLNCDSISSADDEDTNADTDILLQTTKLRSETIVKSLFAKGKHCSRDRVLSSDSAETEEQTRLVLIDAGTSQDRHWEREQSHHILPKTLSECPDNAKNGFTKISEYQDSVVVEQKAEKHALWCNESSTDDVFYTPVSDETDWTIAFCSSGKIQPSCGNGAQPDVLIGTDQSAALSSSLSSLPSDCDESFGADQEDDKAVEVSRLLSVEKELVHDLVVFHQLQGSPSSIVVMVGETSTSQDVIEQVLRLENLPPDWYLYKLCSRTLDPKVINADDCVELNFRDSPLMHLRHKGENLRFELHQKDGIQIKVTCDAGLERTRTLVFGISCDETCENVLGIAAQKFSLNSSTKLCLIEVERSEKGCPMKRVPENQIIAQLHSDYFLLCEREFLASASDIRDQSFISSARTRSQSSHSPGHPSAVEVDKLERKVASLETKLLECEKNCQQKLQKQRNQLDRYRAIAFCTDPVTKAMLLETEIQRLTREMEDEERQMQLYSGLSKTSSNSECGLVNREDELTAMRKSLSAMEKQRTEAYACLTVTKTEDPEKYKTSTSRKIAPPLYSVCREYQGSCLYGLELNKSSLTGLEEHLPFDNDINHVGNGQHSNGGLSLMEGDRILEINGQMVYHLNEMELMSVVGEMTENLRIVLLREETPATDIYVL